MRAAELVLVVLLAVPGVLAAAESEPKAEEMVNNPPYSHWSAFKPGTTVTQREVVTLPNGGREQQTIVSRLVSRDKDKVVVETTMAEAAAGQNSLAESTTTIATYPATVKMRQVDSGDDASLSVTEGVEQVDVKGKKVDAEWVEAVTREGDAVMTEKIWTARDVPGGIIKRTISRKKGDTVLSESLLELVEYK